MKPATKQFFIHFSKFFSKLIWLALFTAPLAVILVGVLVLFQVLLRDNLITDINGPVSRFVADVNFDKREVKLDATISKTEFSPAQIAIWRLGDGKIIKDTSKEDISKNEAFVYQFKEPGTYTISYSIIDGNNISDEAFCTLRFAKSDPAQVQNQNANATGANANTSVYSNFVESSCGKSTTNYNSGKSINLINYTKSQIRNSIMVIIIGLIGGIYIVAVVRPKFK